MFLKTLIEKKFPNSKCYFTHNEFYPGQGWIEPDPIQGILGIKPDETPVHLGLYLISWTHQMESFMWSERGKPRKNREET